MRCKNTRSWSPREYPNSFNYRLIVYLQTGLIMSPECISLFTSLSFYGAPQLAAKLCLQPVQIFCVSWGRKITTQIGIRNESMRINNHSNIRSRNDVHSHKQCSNRNCFLSNTAVVLVGLSMIVPAAPRFVVRTPRLVIRLPKVVSSAPTCSQLCPNLSLELDGALKSISMTPTVRLYRPSEILVTSKADWNVLLGYDTHPTLRNVRLHFTSSLTLQEASSDCNSLC